MKIKVFLALLLVFCIFVPVLAQTTTTPPPPQMPQPQTASDDKDDVVRITTNLVQVDAVVTKDGKPVRNLTAEDFEVFEDGRKQTITSFAYISNVAGVPSQPVAAVREKGTDVVPVSPVKRDVPRRIMAFVVDDLGLSAQSVTEVRKQLRKYLAQLQPNDLVAIIRTGGEVGALQQFTSDRRVLNRAVDRLRWNPCSRVGLFIFQPAGAPPVGGGSCGGGSVSDTLHVLRFILDGMAQLPGRKSMVVLSDSIPIERQEEGLNVSGNDSHVGSPDSIPESLADSGFSYTAALRKIAEKAIRASVVIYSVDTQGLVTTGLTAADSIGSSIDGTVRVSRININEQLNTLMRSRSKVLWDRREGGDLIARQTGGFQVRNSNSFDLDRISEDQSGYYLIGYRPTAETFNRRFHHIKAKVKRSGMSLRTRNGFFGVSEEEANKGKLSTNDLTNLALISPFGSQDVNLNITSFFANDKTAGSMIRSFVYIDPNDLTFTSSGGTRQTLLELQGAVFGDNGALAQQLTRAVPVSLSDQDYEQARIYGMTVTVDIPIKKPGDYQVRIVVRDKNSSRIGSAGQFVAVPNLKDKHLAVSGIVLGTATNNARQEIVAPGTRLFKRNSEIHFAYVIYNATSENGALRNLVTQARLYRDGKNVYTAPETPMSFANQTDLARVFESGIVRLPAELEPGDYYLQIVVMETGVKDKKALPLIQWADFGIEN